MKQPAIYRHSLLNHSDTLKNTEEIWHFHNSNAGEVLLSKMEMSGRVPSKEKFRRMPCVVRT
jgi:hypothetical protein